jgi:hypothetical protein
MSIYLHGEIRPPKVNAVIATSTSLELLDWRRRVARLYQQVRASTDPADAHAHWRSARDELFRDHPQSPLRRDDPLRASGLPYWPYDPALRVEAPLRPIEPLTRVVPTATDGDVTLHRIGRVELDEFGFGLDVWWLAQYAGGLFIPVRDATAGQDSYGGGRYLLDTAKGADLGGTAAALICDFNFLYHPSCRYDPQWECPLAPPGNTIAVRLEAGERLG